MTVKSSTENSSSLQYFDRCLYLKTQGNAKSWVFKYQMNGKRREIGLGSRRLIGVSAARAQASRYRAMIADGVDPADVVAEMKAEARAANAKTEKQEIPTFEKFSLEAIDRLNYLRRWTNDKHATQWVNTLKTYAFPIIGQTPVDQVTAQDIVQILQPYWETKTTTMDRLCDRLRAIFAQAISNGLIDKNPAAWEGNLEKYLPKPSLIVREKGGQQHHAAVPAAELKRIVAQLREKDTPRAKAALFGILTVGRSSEYTKAKWSEFDLEAGLFYVPNERRKSKKPGPHIVPLSRQAKELIESMPQISPYVFTFTGRVPLSIDGIRMLIQGLTDQKITAHGSRSTFSDWCAENEKNFLVSERCLDHEPGNKVFMAYQRDTLVEQRRRLLQEWADFLYGELSN